MPKQSMGEFLSTLRKASGYTQQEVAEKLNVSNRTLSSWETDRTTPDILLLPAIADIYGVTVDDILRGERQQNIAENSQISDKARKALRKEHLGRLSSQINLLMGISIVWTILFGVLSLSMSNNISYPTWLIILLAVIAICGSAADLFAVIFFARMTLLQDGITEQDDVNDANAAFTLAVKHKIARFLKVCSLPYIFIALMYLSIYFGAYKYFGLSVIFMFAAYGLAALISGFICNCVFVASTKIENNLKSQSYNRKLALKICKFGSIPVALALVLFVVFTFALPEITTTQAIYYTADSVEEVKQKLQTVTIDDDDLIVQRYGYEAGEYYLNFNTDEDNKILDGLTVDHWLDLYDLGNGFYGDLRLDGGWNIYVLKADKLPTEEDYVDGYLHTDDFFSPLGFDYKIYYYDDFEAVNVAYYYANYIDDVVLRISYNQSENQYRFEQIKELKMWGIYLTTLLSVTGATVVTCTILFVVFRKKYNYSA